MPVQAFQQVHIDFAAAGQFAVAVVVEAFQLGEKVEGLVGDAKIVGDTPAVLVVGNIGNAADVEANLIVAEKELVADGHKGRTLSAFADIFAAEVVDDGEIAGLGQLLTVADLQGVMLLRLVENGVSVRGYKIGLGVVFLGKSQHLFAKIAAIIFIQLHQIFRFLMESLGELRFPMVGIGKGFGFQNMEAVFVVFLLEAHEGDVQAVKRAA